MYPPQHAFDQSPQMNIPEKNQNNLNAKSHPSTEETHIQR